MKSWARPLIGWAALVLGIGGVVASLAVTSTRAGEGLTFGFAAFIAFFGLLSLLVRNPTPITGACLCPVSYYSCCPGSVQASPLIQEPHGPHGRWGLSRWPSALSDG